MNPLLIDVPETIETPRLILRAPRAGEAEEMNKAVHESINELQPWMPWANPAPDLAATRIFCQNSLADFALRRELGYRAHLRETGLFAGNISILRMNWNVPRFEIGYWIRTSLAGGGYASEAVAALTRLAFDSFKAARVEIQTDELNTRSRRVAERAGFVLEGILRNQYRHRNGELRNACVYSRIAAQPVGG